MYRKLYPNLTLRECQYLEFIQKHDVTLYENILQKLKEERYCELVNTLKINKKKKTEANCGDTMPLFDGNAMEMK